MVKPELVRAMKRFLPLLVAGGHMPRTEAENIDRTIEAVAELVEESNASSERDDAQHLVEAATLRAFEQLLPLRAPLSDPAEHPRWKDELAAEACDAGAALAHELRQRARQMRVSTAPPPAPEGLDETELTELFGSQSEDGQA